MAQHKPTLSVIIPTRTRSALLNRTLRSLTLLATPTSDYEVIVVDTGSTDDTARVCAEAQQRGLPLRYEFADKPGQHIGRNRGARLARGEVLVYADDDIRVAPGWLTAIAETFEAPRVGLVGGPALPDYEVPPPAWVVASWRRADPGRALWYYSLVDAGDQVVDVAPNMVLGCNYAIRRRLLLELGGFPPDVMPAHLKLWQGDGESGVAQEVARRGWTIRYHPRARVHHFVPRSRMTIQYVFRRGEYQGILASYTALRRHDEPLLQKPIAARARGLGRLLAGAVRQLPAGELGCITPEAARLAHQIGWELGFSEHQQAVARSPALASWVVKRDYLDESDSPS